MAEPNPFVEHDARGSGARAPAHSYAAKTRADRLGFRAECDSASCGFNRRTPTVVNTPKDVTPAICLPKLPCSEGRKPGPMGLAAYAGAAATTPHLVIAGLDPAIQKPRRLSSQKTLPQSGARTHKEVSHAETRSTSVAHRHDTSSRIHPKAVMAARATHSQRRSIAFGKVTG